MFETTNQMGVHFFEGFIQVMDDHLSIERYGGLGGSPILRNHHDEGFQKCGGLQNHPFQWVVEISERPFILGSP